MSGFKVNFSVNNQLATPSIHAAALANRPAAGQPGRVFIDTDNPSTGIYRDTGIAWIKIGAPSSPEVDTLQTVTDRGNTTTQSVTINSSNPPQFPLDVYGDTDIINVHATNGNDGVILFSKSGSHRWRAGNYHGGGNDYFSIYNMQENSDGILVNISTNNVAIGGHTTTPTYKVDIAGSLANTGSAYLGTSGASSGFNTTTPDTTSVLTIERGSKTENLWLTSSDGTNSIEFSDTAGTIRTGIQANSSGLGFGGGTSFRNALFITRTSNVVLINTTTDPGNYKLRVFGGIAAGTNNPVAGWDLYVGTSGMRVDGICKLNLIQCSTFENNSARIDFRVNSGATRFLRFVDQGGTQGAGTYIEYFATNNITGIAAGTANLQITNPTISNIDAGGVLNFNTINATINQTLGSGTIYGFRFNPTNTAVLSKVYAFHASSGNVNFSGLPTSSAGLVSGDLWNDLGTLKIV